MENAELITSSKKPDAEFLNREIDRLRASIAAIHWAVTTKDLTRESVVGVIKECEHAIPDLKGLREHVWAQKAMETAKHG